MTSDKYTGKLIKSNLSICFIKVNENNENKIQDELSYFDEHNQDPLSTWLKLAKAKGETKNTDPLILELIIQLHKKIDTLEKIITNEENKTTMLENTAKIIAIGHEHIRLDSLDIISDKLYGRIKMPIFPAREIPILSSHHNDNIYKIDYISAKDTRDYDSYIVATERANIRKSKVKCE